MGFSAWDTLIEWDRIVRLISHVASNEKTTIAKQMP